MPRPGRGYPTQSYRPRVNFVATTLSAGLIGTLTDTFTASDTAKWEYGTTTTVTGGQLSMPCRTDYQGYTLSKNAYTLTGSSILWENPQFADPTNANVANQFYLRPVKWTSTDQIELIVGGGLTACRHNVGGVQISATYPTYDAVAHRWLRIRESAGTVYWDASASGVSWTNLHSTTVSFAAQPLYVTYQPGYVTSIGTPTTWLVDNVGIPGVPALHTADFFVMF